MLSLLDISKNIESTAGLWSRLAVTNGWATEAEAEVSKFRSALLLTAVAVLSADEPLNVYESLLLQQLFGSNDDLSMAEVKATMGKNLLSESMPFLIDAVRGFSSKMEQYRPDRDPVITVLSQILEAGLAADKFPSEAEAWATSRVLTKLRGVSLSGVNGLEVAVKRSTDALPHVEHSKTPKPLMELIKTGEAPQKSDTAGALSDAADYGKLDRHRGMKPESDRVQSLLSELNSLVGLANVKEQVETLVNLAKVMAMRTERGLPSPDISFHLVFSGNPGTGKTTVARILGQIYGALGLMTIGKCIEVDRAALVGQYLGQTTTKTMGVLSESLGSVLFVDEAYSLTEGDSNDYGKEAISVILKFMEDHRDNFVLIAAGYTEQMEQFLESNPGLRSRFSRTIDFPDYNLDELVQIFGRMCASDGYRIESDALPQLREVLAALLRERSANFANAREVRKIYEHALEQQANRVVGTDCTDDELCLLKTEDISRDKLDRIQ